MGGVGGFEEGWEACWKVLRGPDARKRSWKRPQPLGVEAPDTLAVLLLCDLAAFRAVRLSDLLVLRFASRGGQATKSDLEDGAPYSTCQRPAGSTAQPATACGMRRRQPEGFWLRNYLLPASVRSACSTGLGFRSLGFRDQGAGGFGGLGYLEMHGEL